MIGADAEPFLAVLIGTEGGGLTWTTTDLKDDQRIRAEDLLREGNSVRDVAEELGMSKSAVHRLKKRMGTEEKADGQPDLLALADAVLSRRDSPAGGLSRRCPTVPPPGRGTADWPSDPGNPWVSGVPSAVPREGETGQRARGMSRPVPLVVPAPGQAGTDERDLRVCILAGACDVEDVRADREAIAADNWPNGPPPRTEPPADLVERLAAARPSSYACGPKSGRLGRAEGRAL